jgi:hypothetical protein
VGFDHRSNEGIHFPNPAFSRQEAAVCGKVLKSGKISEQAIGRSMTSAILVAASQQACIAISVVPSR